MLSKLLLSVLFSVIFRKGLLGGGESICPPSSIFLAHQSFTGLRLTDMFQSQRRVLAVSTIN